MQPGTLLTLDCHRKFRKGLKEPFVLDLSGFSIINIPNLERVGSCQVMNFSRNALKTLEERLMWDTHHNLAWHNKLRELDLSSNALKKFPHVLTRLVSLVQIDVSDNNIAELPAEIRFLTRLMTLKAEGNPLSSPTLTVVHDGVETYVIRGSEAHAVAMGMSANALSVTIVHAGPVSRVGPGDIYSEYKCGPCFGCKCTRVSACLTGMPNTCRVREQEPTTKHQRGSTPGRFLSCSSEAQYQNFILPS